jgi:hypothetical protein
MLLPDTEARSAGRVVRACLLLAFASLLVPVFLVPIPPLLDYPNHLARLHLLADAVLAGRESIFYAHDPSGAWINSAVDWLGVALSTLVPTGTAGSLLVALAVALPAGGAVLLNRVIFGTWHWWQIAFALFAWNGSLIFGLISYQIGIGLALLAAAGHALAADRMGPVTCFAARALTAGLLLLVHPFAAAFFAALLLGLVAGEKVPPGGLRAWAASRGLPVLAAAMACAMPILAYLARMLLAPAVDGPPSEALVRALDEGMGTRIVQALLPLLAPIWTYSIGLDVLFFVPLLCVAGAVILSGAGFRGHAGLIAVSGGLVVLAVVLPVYLLGNGATNWRIGALLGFAVATACQPAPTFPATRAARAGVAVALTLLVVLRSGLIGSVWWSSRDDTRSVLAALSHIRPGSTLLPVEHTPSPNDLATGPSHRRTVGLQPVYWHLATLAVTRDAFVPTLFATPGKQTMIVRPPWDRLAVHEPFLPSIHDLAVADLETRIAGDPQLYGYRYLKDWQRRFDYVLVLNADRPDELGPAPRLPELELVVDEGFAQLWRVRRP